MNANTISGLSIFSLSCACFFGMSASAVAEPVQPAEPVKATEEVKSEDIDVRNPEPHAKEANEVVLKRVKSEKAKLFDVREKYEWNEGHLQQAELLPLSEIGKKINDAEYVAQLKTKFPTDKPIYLHCKVGGRAVLAAEALRKELGPDYDFRPLKPGYEELRESGFINASTADLQPEPEPETKPVAEKPTDPQPADAS